MSHLLAGNRCECSGCGRIFRSVSSFERHRAGRGSDRRCLSDEEMTSEGLRLVDGIWRGEARDLPLSQEP